MINKTKGNSEVFELKSLFINFLDRKWWVLGIFIIILIAGLIISFFKTPQYMVQNTIRVENNYFYYNDEIYRFFPEESNDLWIFPTTDAYSSETRALIEIDSRIMSDEFMKELESHLGNKFLTKDLKDIIDIEINTKERYLEITIVYKNGEDSLMIMDSLIDLLVEAKSSELEDLRFDLINKNNEKIKELENEINRISDLNKSEDNVLPEKEIDSKSKDLLILKEIDDFLQNKELLINRIEVLSSSGDADIQKITNLKRDIVFSFIVAFIIGVLTGFLSNYFINLKRENQGKDFSKNN